MPDMPEIGPTPMQAQILLANGVEFAKIKDMPRSEVIALVGRYKRSPPVGGNLRAATATGIEKRKKEVKRKDLKVGQPVNVRRGDGVISIQNRAISNIDEEGYVHLERTKDRFSPNRVEPASQELGLS